ncbi:hypothetical protein ACF1AB_40100 [Streptomyces sp. NPDC014846]|uniref:hypothetical protein n=1 Tax=Streptomyces sp. NPDC014846 TaxID=3364922 RepID=UPI0036FC8032
MHERFLDCLQVGGGAGACLGFGGLRHGDDGRVPGRCRKAALFDALATTGKALSNGKRLELLDLLAQGEEVDALAKAAGLGLTTASAHL